MYLKSKSQHVECNDKLVNIKEYNNYYLVQSFDSKELNFKVRRFSFNTRSAKENIYEKPN